MQNALEVRGLIPLRACSQRGKQLATDVSGWRMAIWCGSVVMSLAVLSACLVNAISWKDDSRSKRKAEPLSPQGMRYAVASPMGIHHIVPSSIPKKASVKPYYLQVGSEETEDKISQLPDEVLFIIFQHLSAKEVIRTSILSKCWRNIYRFVPHLNFNCLDIFGCYLKCHKYTDTTKSIDRLGLRVSKLQKKFVNGVDTVLHLHSGSKITTCNLACCFHAYFPNKLEQWISSLGRLGVEKLSLCLACNNPHSDPQISSPSKFPPIFPPIFPCQLISEMPFLERFTLSGCFLEPNLTNQCKFLKFLDLVDITMVPSSVKCILSSCFNLQSLKMVRCTCYSILSIRGRNLQLEALCVDSCCGIPEIELDASNLTTFECYSQTILKFSFNHVPKLDNVCLSLGSNDIKPLLCGELGRALPQLKYLTFQADGRYQDMRLLPWINLFDNLRQLSLAFLKMGPDLHSLASVLDICPLLEEFHLSREEPTKSKEQAVSRSIETHRHLKKVKFDGFHGSRDEINFAACILRSAVALEIMHISPFSVHFARKGEWSNSSASSSTITYEIIQPLQEEAICNGAKVVVQLSTGEVTVF